MSIGARRLAVFTLFAGSFVLPPAGVRGDESSVLTIPVPERGKPSAAKVDAQGNIHLVFETQDGPRYARSTDGGRKFSPSIPLVDKTSRKPGLVFQAEEMAVGKGGVVHVVLSDNAWKLKLPKDEWGLHYARLEAGAKSFAPLKNINHKPSEGFSIAADDQGNVTCCWLADKLYANISKDNGKTFAPFAEINPDFDPCNCCTTRCTYAADGRLAILYRERPATSATCTSCCGTR